MLAEPTGGRVKSVLYCGAKKLEDRERGERYARTCGQYLGTIHGARLVETGRILVSDVHVDYREGRVFYAPRCSVCGLLTEFEIVWPPDATAESIAAGAAPRTASHTAPTGPGRRRRRAAPAEDRP